MKLALIGNPNSGKTTLFNALTGASAHVGNWPGVTVEKKTGYYKKNKQDKIEIIDLPGIYSLSPYTPEEIISRNYLLNEYSDGIINIVDATNLERNLYLTTQLLELDIPVVVALNMMDIVTKEGAKIDPDKLAKILGVKVVLVSALRAENIEKLMDVATIEAKSSRKGNSILLDSDLGEMIKVLTSKINDHHSMFRAIKLIEEDEEIAVSNKEELTNILNPYKENYPENIFDNDFGGIVADARYQFISKHIKGILTKKENKLLLTKSDKIDKVLTNKVFGIPIFLGIMFVIFHLTFSEQLLFISLPNFSHAIFGEGGIASSGVILQNCMLWFTDEFVASGITNWLGETGWAASLVGSIWAAVGAVLSFVPQILLLFLFITILEDSGYMARVAFIMDRIFRKLGLTGKAFMPLLMCFGCAVPGIMAARTLEQEKERRLTIMLTPFFSCGAKVPIWQTFALVIYEVAGVNQGLTVFLVYLVGIAVAIIAAIIVNTFFLKGKASPFVMELPAYHSPTLKNTTRRLWEKLKGYVVRAGTIIAASSVIIWFLSSFGFTASGFGFVEINESLLGYIGKGLSYLFYPLGFASGEYGYFFVIAALTGLVAKEEVPATLEALVSVSGVSSITALATASFSGNVAPAMWSFMIFNLLTVPCMAAVAAASKELGGKKKLWIAILFWLAVSYVGGILFYFGVKIVPLGIVFILLVVALVVFSIIKGNKKNKDNIIRKNGV
ncbi:ferrous iron transport protein B [Acholeplasma sp. OttesenSCG-928-E16]|nr:ferrous iron transport protein B [Acholeplasma sp. OttesenSCG-928-E16]